MRFAPTDAPLLECVKRLTLRAHPAGQKMVGTAVCSEAMRSRLRRQIRRSFELEFDLNRPHSPPCPTFPVELAMNVIRDSGGEVGQGGVKDG